MAISLGESIAVGFSDFWSRKVRSVVTIMGIVLGTMSIIVVLSLIDAVNKKTMQWIEERGGLTRITVERNWEFRDLEGERPLFTRQEIAFIRSQIPEAKYFNAVITIWRRTSITRGDKQTEVRYIGVMPDNQHIEEWYPYPDGRFINEFDLAQANDVICIGTNIRDELFGNMDPIGEYVSLAGRRMQVIGVMEHRYMKADNEFMGDNMLDWMNNNAFIPVTTLMRKTTSRNQITSFEVKTETVEETARLKAKLEDLMLNMRHGKPVFVVHSAQEQATEIGQQTRVFGIIFFMISAISMLVGGIVIMNIMLATIQERTREIGVRLAVGARRFDIFMQFMVQTVLITTLGGIIGVAGGLSILKQVGVWLKMDTAATPTMIVIAVTISAGVGLVFGVLPAISASNLNPVKALRYE
ncbi:MAG: ABC transporter permease [Candidatus Cloacimonetes bacterium]|nr:ABC transporter permease [Candidatus Cloacimonadota bacterium]